MDCEVPWVKLAEAVEMCGEKEVADKLLKAVTPAGEIHTCIAHFHTCIVTYFCT